MDKMLAAKGILSEIIASGAQFLKKDTSSRCWYIADVKVGKDKISHVLRIIERAKEKKGESSSQSAAAKASFSHPNHSSHGDVSELDQQAQQKAASLLQQQQATA